MGATLRRGYQIDIAFSDHMATFSQPGNRPIRHFGFPDRMANERIFRQGRCARQYILQITL